MTMTVAVGCGGRGGGTTVRDPKVLTPSKLTNQGLMVAPGVTAVDLKGLDRPAKLSGPCFTQSVVQAAGVDVNGSEHYTMTFTLKGDPKDTVDLYRLLAKDKCGPQQRQSYDKASSTLGLTPAAAGLLVIAYRTSSGRRIF
jgi:hypothetical protein